MDTRRAARLPQHPKPRCEQRGWRCAYWRMPSTVNIISTVREAGPRL